ncbi:TVP38/TMEM64 family protein [Anaerococcus sp. AGMB00486]|uniref:TVP38/TMEM64 family membrane protein n=2 Tax=Anaerococcus TaxID=165779 RepID=A0ABX2NBF5_9FIRM|nr:MULTISPECIES: VTT domain-containing protein [Anaerococcus]MDY3005602.1 VTT domain-containing protein [Anaerococcus porci]MSS78146.1 TVP38/TMEM64 family protein [Anaerococcus porci]NVF12050.1 TVP38/TMEM64 family protein [Anaerococcus faecalis]
MKTFFKKYKRKIKFILSLIISLIILFGLYKLYKLGILTNEEKLYTYIGNFAILAPFVFIILKILVGLLPFIPNTLIVLIGFALFGPLWGLFLNYISSLITGVLNFSITRIYGERVLKKFLSKKNLKKYKRIRYQSKNRFKKILLISCIIPFAPDNALSLIGGLKDINFKDYFKVILLGKFIEIILLSIIIYKLGQILI